MKPESSANSDTPAPELPSTPLENIDRRTFLMRNAVIGAAAVMTGTAWTNEARAAQAAKEAAAKPALNSASISPDLDVVKRSKGPVMTILEEFYKVGPGPSSSHTIGPMRITYDFYQRCTKLPADQLKQATGLKVHLFGSSTVVLRRGRCASSVRPDKRRRSSASASKPRATGRSAASTTSSSAPRAARTRTHSRHASTARSRPAARSSGRPSPRIPSPSSVD